MNIDYLYNVLNLYLLKENEKKTILTITKGSKYVFAFGVDGDSDVTKVYLKDEEVSIELLQDIIKKYKGDSIVIDDRYKLDDEKKTCKYESLLNNGRKFIFNKFTLEEANLLRNIIYNIAVENNELRINLDTKEKEIPYNLRLKEAGFSSFVTIFLVGLFIVDIIVIVLWIFKHLS